MLVFVIRRQKEAAFVYIMLYLQKDEGFKATSWPERRVQINLPPVII